MINSNQFILWGSGGHAKVLADIIFMRKGNILALFDNNKVLSVISGVPVFKGKEKFISWIAEQSEKKYKISGLVAIGGSRGKDRLKIQSLFHEYGLTIPVLRHPSSIVSPSAHLGKGTQVLAFSIIAAETELGDACIINHRASVDHECKIGNGVHIGPSATLCGRVSVADNVFIGAGAVILPDISIGENSIIGAGAVVTSNVFANSTLAGNPARLINIKS
jgi:sugar O-acyltransferase (sialic acid O-acetyltransferase NeuD family)